MKGLFPWLREALFGPPTIVCSRSCCDDPPAPNEICGAGLCMHHHVLYCINYNRPPNCAAGRDGLLKVDTAFLREKKP